MCPNIHTQLTICTLCKCDHFTTLLMSFVVKLLLNYRAILRYVRKIINIRRIIAFVFTKKNIKLTQPSRLLFWREIDR